MTECNCDELLAAAKHKTTCNIELLVATRYPKDGLQCTHVDPLGNRCNERALLQFHHVQPCVRGGTHDPANLTLRCAAHNYYAAVQDYGTDMMRRKRDRPHHSSP